MYDFLFSQNNFKKKFSIFSLIINDNLKTGTQLPFIKKAKEGNYSVVVMNSNDNERLINGRLTPIAGSEDPVAHVCTVWKDYVLGEFKADKIIIVAHSFGGVATLALVIKIILAVYQ